MLPALVSVATRPNQLFRIRLAFQQRSLASVPSSTPSKSSNDPPLITGMPKLNIPPEYAGLIDVKQEPGFVIINGRRYPYPYPGIHGEYKYLELLEKWRSEGKVDRNNKPIFTKMKGREKILAKQLWYQRDPSMPVWKLGKYDEIWNALLATLVIFQFMFGSWMLYRVIVPKDQDVYIGENWIRWHKETKH